jgi:hypothetical protein
MAAIVANIRFADVTKQAELNSDSNKMKFEAQVSLQSLNQKVSFCFSFLEDYNHPSLPVDYNVTEAKHHQDVEISCVVNYE